MCTAAVPGSPSVARFKAARPYARAGSGRACMYGSSTCTMSAPAANRSRISSRTASAYAAPSSATIVVVVVLRLLGHRERPRHGHLHRARRVRAQELEVAHLHRVLALDRADHARHRVRMAAAVQRRARVVDVDAFERGREAVRVALAPHLAVGDDVQPGALLVGDREPRGVVVRLLQVGRIDPPQLAGADPRREAAAELLAVDQPVRLRVGTDEAGLHRRESTAAAAQTAGRSVTLRGCGAPRVLRQPGRHHGRDRDRSRRLRRVRAPRRRGDARLRGARLRAVPGGHGARGRPRRARTAGTTASGPTSPTSSACGRSWCSTPRTTAPCPAR